jgi:hypothetical protein
MNFLGTSPSTSLRIAEGKFLKEKNIEHPSPSGALDINKIQ